MDFFAFLLTVTWKHIDGDDSGVREQLKKGMYDLLEYEIQVFIITPSLSIHTKRSENVILLHSTSSSTSTRTCIIFETLFHTFSDSIRDPNHRRRRPRQQPSNRLSRLRLLIVNPPTNQRTNERTNDDNNELLDIHR